MAAALLLSVALCGRSFAIDVERPSLVLGDPNTCAGKIKRVLVQLLARPLGLKRLESAYMGAMKDEGSGEFFGKVLKQLDITVDAAGKDLENIPKEGGLLIYANHPFGFTDGAAVMSAVKSVRPDVKVLMNDIVRMPGLKDDIVSVSIRVRPEKTRRLASRA